MTILELLNQHVVEDQNAVEQAPDGVDELIVKIIAQMAAIVAARRAIEMYEKYLTENSEIVSKTI